MATRTPALAHSDTRRRAWLWACLLLAGPAGAQIQLPQVQVPALPPLPGAVATPLQAATDLTSNVLREQINARAVAARTLIRENRTLIEADPAGAPMRRAELLAMAPGDATLQTAVAAGFEILRRQPLADAGELVVLRAPARLSTRRALARLRSLDPQGSYDYNHIFQQSGAAAVYTTSTSPAPPRASNGTAIHIGLIDGGVAASHPSLAAVAVHGSGCEGKSIPTAHGTAVASLIASTLVQSGLNRANAPNVEIDAADVYCGQPTGGSVDTLASAFTALMQRQASIINISLVGPRNLALELLTRAAQQRGVLIVAAVGNDGPAARPLYPAALPGVIAVTGVDAQRRVLAEAGRGPHVQFAALGDLMSADAASALVHVRGTSFAAPIVSGLLAAFAAMDGNADGAAERLRQQAIDLGKRGRDPVYGVGMVGAELQFPAPPRS